MKDLIRKLWVPISLAALLFALYYPSETRIAPEWEVRVIDENGNPVAQALVGETWQEYSIEQVSHEDQKTTPFDGIVHFESRTIRASFASRISGCFKNFRSLGVHASCGAFASVRTGKCNYGKMRADWDRSKGSSWQGWSKRMNATLFLRRCPPGRTGIECWPDYQSASDCLNKSEK
jgi:hypothetical protein